MCAFGNRCERPQHNQGGDRAAQHVERHQWWRSLARRIDLMTRATGRGIADLSLNTRGRARATMERTPPPNMSSSRVSAVQLPTSSRGKRKRCESLKHTPGW
jgi:hypothetical protein